MDFQEKWFNVLILKEKSILVNFVYSLIVHWKVNSEKKKKIKFFWSVVEGRLLERGKTSGRVDDNIEAIIKRFNTYSKQTKPVINYFEAVGRLRTVDTSKDVDTAYANVLNVLGLDEKK